MVGSIKEGIKFDQPRDVAIYPIAWVKKKSLTLKFIFLVRSVNPGFLISNRKRREIGCGVFDN